MVQELPSGVGQVPAVQKSIERRRGNRKSETFDEDLEWFLVAGSSAMRERGTLGAVINVLELGGVDRGGVPNTDLYSDAQVGFGKHVVGEIERYRWLSWLWLALDRKTQAVLLACYVAPRAEFRADAGFGARDTSPRVEETKRGGVQSNAYGRHGESGPPGASEAFGELAGLVFWSAERPERITAALWALRERDKGGRHADARRLLKAELKAAREAATEAHKVWRENKTGRPRKPRERVARAPVYTRPLDELP